MSNLTRAEDWARTMVLTPRSLMPHDQPELMKAEQCIDCGAMFTRPKGKRHHRCPDCKIARSVAAQVNTAERSGPMYERLVLGQWKHWRREVERLGLDPEGG